MLSRGHSLTPSAFDYRAQRPAPPATTPPECFRKFSAARAKEYSTRSNRARRVVEALEVMRIKNFPDVEKRLGLDATRNHREHPGSSFPAR